MIRSQFLLGILTLSLLSADGAGQSPKKAKPADKPAETVAEKADKALAKPPVVELATVDDQKITDDDLAPYVAGQLRPLREQEYQIKKKALDTLIGERILASEAKKKGLSVEKLLEQEVDAKVPEPTDVEINAVYAVQREQLNRPLEEVKGQIQQSDRK